MLKTKQKQVNNWVIELNLTDRMRLDDLEALVNGLGRLSTLFLIWLLGLSIIAVILLLK